MKSAEEFDFVVVHLIEWKNHLQKTTCYSLPPYVPTGIHHFSSVSRRCDGASWIPWQQVPHSIKIIKYFMHEHNLVHAVATQLFVICAWCMRVYLCAAEHQVHREHWTVCARRTKHMSLDSRWRDRASESTLQRWASGKWWMVRDISGCVRHSILCASFVTHSALIFRAKENICIIKWRVSERTEEWNMCSHNHVTWMLSPHSFIHSLIQRAHR